MRVAFISTMRGNAWGGSEELWFEAAKNAAERGDKVLASVGHWSGSALQLQTLKSLGVEIHVQEPPRSLLKKSDFTGRLSSKLKQLKHGSAGYAFAPVARFKPDIICINQANTHDLPRFPHLHDFLLEAQIPYAVICHGHEDTPLTDEARELTAAHFKNAKWVGFVAESLIRSAERHLATNIETSFVIRNPVNLPDVSEVTFEKSDDVLRFASVARVECYQKGQDILLEALAGERWRERSWSLSFAGEGPHVLYLQQLAKHYQLENKVRFCGQISDVRGIWAEHQFLVLPSRYEGTPLSLVEAMLCGRPAVVTDVAGNGEWIEDRVNGFVAAAANAASIGSALEKAWEARAHWRELGAAARRTALAQYPPNPGAVLINLLVKATEK